MVVPLILGIVISYLIGSICSAVLISKLYNLPDPRQSGSNNPGATNVLRLAGKKYAAIVLLADSLKGLIPVAIANLFHANPIILGCMSIAAVVGHIYPIFFKFKGGKGVATTLGVLFGLNILLGLAVCITWVIIAAISKYSSLAALIALLLAPFYAIGITQHVELFPALFFLWILVLYKHRENITRLVDGSESKINWGKKS
jgi:acyl phosphate:glycerol-3-phosphate acyltransferase